MTKLLLSLFSILTITASAQDAQEATQKLVKPAPDSSKVSVTDGTNGKGPDKRVKPPEPADDADTLRILTNMAKQAGWFPDIKISVQDGLVTLAGRANNAEQLLWLAKTADRLPTVVAVINQVEVETPPATDLTPAWKEFKRLLEKAKTALPLVSLALILLGILWFAGRFISRGIQALWGRHIHNPFLLTTVTRLTMLPIWVLFFYLVLQTAGLSALATTIIGGTGAIGIVIGFAFKDIAENYLSGLLLAIRSPFTKGDEIVIDQYAGYVQSLNMRGTTITDYDGNVVLIPNRIVIQSVIKNLTTSPKTRSSFNVGIGYNDSVEKAQEVIYAALKKVPTVLNDPSPLAVAIELTSSTINIKVMFWYDCVKSSLFRTRSQCISLVKENLLANGFTLPDEAREVVLAAPLQVRMLESGDEESAVKEKRMKDDQEQARKNFDTSGTSQSGGHERDVERISAGANIFKKMDHST